MKYLVEVIITDKGICTAKYNTKRGALDACFIFFSGMDFTNRYSNCKYLERNLKPKEIVAAGISDAYKQWHITVRKILE